MPPKKRIRNVETTTLDTAEIQTYLESTYRAFKDFYKNLRVNEAINSMTSHLAPFEIIENPSEALCRWRDTHSIPYCLRTIQAKDLAHLSKEKVIKKPKLIPQTADKVEDLEKIKFLESKCFNYQRSIKMNPLYQGKNVHKFVESLIHDDAAFLDDSKITQGSGLAMFCGGPISALAFCPRTDSSSKEILAVTTFADEINLFLPGNESSYIQLWAIDSSLGNAAECLVLFEVPRCTVVAMAWCPILVNHSDRCFKSRLSRGQKTNNDCLGLLAVATDKGVVFIYNVPRQLSDMSNPQGSPFIFRASPVATLVQKAESGHCAGIGILKWSYYNGGTRLLGVSDDGQVLVWSLEKATEPFEDPQDLQPHMRAINRVYLPVTVFKNANWEAPVFDAAWMGEDKLVVSLRSRIIYLYSWPSMEELLVESKPRSTGQILLQVPELHEGFYSFDTTVTNVDSISYVSGSYFTFDRDDVLLSYPLINRHQIQINDAAVSVRSGILSTVGMDGRLMQGLNARVTTKFEEQDDDDGLVFQYGRPLLHLVRLRRELEKENQPPLARKHDECLQNSWLELRAGDAALLDMNSSRKHVHMMPEALLDRRTEALTRISSSVVTDGLVATGGEAGLVFLLPTLL